MTNLKKGDRVKVDFINNPETIHAGIQFTGYGVLDRVEDGRVFGRLEDGQTFMCFASDVEVLTERNQEVGDDSHGDYTQMTLGQLQQEHAELLLFNDELDRNCKAHKAKANKYQTKCWHIQTLLMNPVDKDMTLKAIKTVIERVGEF
ncbi:hypothetical protein [Acinetobacter haemolyticus]|uniref:hypothetical protein n=1 Tax=Acinetobacter haemolyticus TaxID=29430 RepID=UPI001D1805CE|nr:hypothetical protein [Acinetobacter haemolyticus]